MSRKTPLLLIAFKFPPYSQVGAFRWARLSRYLAELGHRIEVVTVDWKLEDASSLLRHVEHENITIHRIRSGYPHNLKYRRFGSKILSGLVRRLFTLFLDKYIYWDDEAQHWGKYLIPVCESLLRKKELRVVIATGSPFQTNYWAAQLKKRNPEICLIQDLRDPWVRDPVLSYDNMQEALTMEYETLSAADQLVVVSEGMKRHFAENSRNGLPIAVINNGHDLPGDPAGREKRQSEAGCISIVYAGSLSCGREEILWRALDLVISEEIRGIRWVLVGNIPAGLVKRYHSLIEDGRLEVKGWVPQKTAIEIVSQADYALQLNSEIYPYALSTKIFEYAALRVPCISLNYGGDIEQVIRDGSFGYSINMETDNLSLFLHRIARREIKDSFSFEIDRYSYKQLAIRYSELIQSIQRNKKTCHASV